MVIRVGINGFGRIGRLVLRIMLKRSSEFKVVAIHDLANAATLAHLLKYDTAFGRLDADIKVVDDNIVVNGDVVLVNGEKVGPSKIDWGTGIDIVVEATGIFREKKKGEKDGYDGHIGQNGCKKVLLTVPSKDEIDATVVLGCNDEELKKEDKFISNASCTTNCLAPIAKVLNDTFGIVRGAMVTVHAYTNDQRIADMIHSDLRRARAAAQNIIPTSTGAAKAIGKVVPDLAGKLDGYALRVPVITGSLVDLTVELEKKATREEVNAAMLKAAEGDMKGVLEYTEDPIVSSDIIGNDHSSIFDSKSTIVMGGNFVKVLSWYDNEWGYSNRVCDLIKKAMTM